MNIPFSRRTVALAALGALGSVGLTVAPDAADAQPKAAGKYAASDVRRYASDDEAGSGRQGADDGHKQRGGKSEDESDDGKYVAGDFHNHTTCSDGSISMQKLVKKATSTWRLDWFVQAGHGGNGNRNCTLTEDASLATPGYPFTNQGPTTTWANSIGVAQLKGDNAAASGNMWRWQSLQSFQYPLLENLAANHNLPLFLGLESVVAGHEHASMSVITGQMPAAIDTASIAGPNTVLGNANALAQWSYCFDRADTDTSRGTTNQWSCEVPGSTLSTVATSWWNDTAKKLLPTAGTGTGNGVGDRGHLKTLEAVKWMAANHGRASYYVPAHLERAGPFNPLGNNGYNVEHLRNLNNAAPHVAFGFETQPGHGASENRGEYLPRRNNIGGVLTDSVGGTTYGGTGVYGAVIGGVWDALLGEGRNFWFFASSDWHNRGIFSADDRRSTQDFQPGEYQRNYTLVRNGHDKLRPQTIVNGLRSGNNWATTGQLIDRLAFVACAGLTPAQARAVAAAAADDNGAPDSEHCATMGEKLVVPAGTDVVVAIVVRDPAGTNNSPYTFPNPSLKQIGVTQPINQPVLDHFDLIGGLVTGYRAPGAADYAGEWPRNTAWLGLDGSTPANLSGVPAAAKNTSAALKAVFNASNWSAVSVGGATGWAGTYTIHASASQYVRVRGTNLPPSVPFETDASGNPLSDLFTNASNPGMLKIPCTTVGTNVPALGLSTPATGPIDGCPTHLPVVAGVKYSAYDVAAWSDLWFYGNPIYIQVKGSSVVAGVKDGVVPKRIRASERVVAAR